MSNSNNAFDYHFYKRQYEQKLSNIQIQKETLNRLNKKSNEKILSTFDVRNSLDDSIYSVNIAKKCIMTKHYSKANMELERAEKKIDLILQTI